MSEVCPAEDNIGIFVRRRINYFFSIVYAINSQTLLKCSTEFYCEGMVRTVFVPFRCRLNWRGMFYKRGLKDQCWFLENTANPPFPHCLTIPRNLTPQILGSSITEGVVDSSLVPALWVCCNYCKNDIQFGQFVPSKPYERAKVGIVHLVSLQLCEWWKPESFNFRSSS